MRWRILLSVWCAVALTACWDPSLPDSISADTTEESGSARFITVDPPRGNTVSPVARFSFELPTAATLDSLRLYRGELSEYHQQRIAKGDLPNTLLEREVPVMTWPSAVSDAGAVQAVSSQAQVPLDTGAVYTWAFVGQGPLLSFSVGSEQSIDWRRVWPLPEAGFWGYAAYCRETDAVAADAGPHALDRAVSDAVSDAPLALIFEPGARSVPVQRGLGLSDIGQADCVHLQIADDPLPELLVPPVVAAGRSFDPAPLQSKPVAAVLPVTCEGEWQQLGPGCIRVLDDRITIAAPPSPSLWLLAVGELRFHGVVQGAFAVRGFAPGQQETLQFATLLSDGQRYQGRTTLTMAAAQPHVVINELLANPLGTEPAQEWLELYNDGASVVALEGWTVGDGTGQSLLPAVELSPGEYLIVTSEQYGAAGDDVEFAEGAKVARVPTLGSNGFSNAGEEVRLLSRTGQLQSRFAARSASSAGVSIARVTPEAPDDDLDSFAPHGEPGASPGTANH